VERANAFDKPLKSFDKREMGKKPIQDHALSRLMAITDHVENPRDGARVALLSILGFWSFYFALVTLRWAVIAANDQLAMMGPRALVALVGCALCYGIYLALRTCRYGSIARRVTVAGLLALPAAILFSTTNYYAFNVLHEHLMSKASSSSLVIRKGGDEKETVAVTPPLPSLPAPPSAPAIVRSRTPPQQRRGHEPRPIVPKRAPKRRRIVQRPPPKLLPRTCPPA
jgi:hypothetical protein